MRSQWTASDDDRDAWIKGIAEAKAERDGKLRAFQDLTWQFILLYRILPTPDEKKDQLIRHMRLLQDQIISLNESIGLTYVVSVSVDVASYERKHHAELTAIRMQHHGDHT
jgi:hypothetical protein